MKKAFMLVEIVIVAIIIGILLAIAVPTFLKEREQARGSQCFSNMRLIETAKKNWAKGVPDSDLKNIIVRSILITESQLVPKYLSKMPECPSGGSYTNDGLWFLDDSPKCSVHGEL